MQKTAIGSRFSMPKSVVARIHELPQVFKHRLSGTIAQTFLVMKLTMLLLVVSVFSAHATGMAQTVTISGKNLTLKQVFQAIKKQTGYVVFANEDFFPSEKKMTLSVRDLPLKELLDRVFADQPVNYQFEGETIVLSRKLPKSQRLALPLAERIEAPEFFPIKIRVTDSTGSPLAGASVTNRNSKKSGVTDADGTLNLNVNEGDVLIVSFIGYEDYQLSVTDKARTGGDITISLIPVVASMEELVINTGYQKINRANVTGSVTTVSSKELEKRNAVNILQNLEGTVPGLVQYKGNTTIRGVSTFQANRNILVVVDGLPIEGSIADVNPYDIENINVLKDAAAAAIYGARASNGVIVVTTKRAKEKGRTAVEISSNLTLTNKPDYSYQNFMTPAQQVEWESNYYNWYFNGGGGIGGTINDPIGTFETTLKQGIGITPVQYAHYQFKKGQITQAQLDAVLNEYKQNNFIQEYKDHALLNKVLQQYNLAIRTNSGRSQQSLVVNYTTDNTGIINTYNRRINFHLKGTYGVSNWLDVDYGVNGVVGKDRSHNSAIATNPFSVPSYYRLLNPDGSRAPYYTSQFNAYSTIRDSIPLLYPVTFNHLDELERDFSDRSSLNMRYYVNMNFKLMKGLTINPMFQYEDNRSTISAYSEAETYAMRWLHNVYTDTTKTKPKRYERLLPAGGRLVSTQQRTPNYTARVQANYDRTFDKHGFIALAGAEFRQTRVYGNRSTLLGYDEQLQTQATATVGFDSLYRKTGTLWSRNYPLRQIDFGSISNFALILDDMHRFASAYANLTYTYDRKYSLFGSARKDYADLFGGDEKYRGRPIWSAGAAWVASNEDFMEQFRFVDFLKLRASYGFTGNIKNEPALLVATTGTNSVTRLPNASVANPPNDQLRWEKTATTNIGLDFTLLDNRMRGSLDWYRRKGTDLFARKTLDASEGFSTMVFNNASMVNNGIEFTLGYDWFRPSAAGGFRWSSNLLGAWNKNRVTDIDELTKNSNQLILGNEFRIGYPVRSIFAYQFAGLNANGVAQFYDSKGNKVTSSIATDPNSVRFIGDSDPRVNMSFNNDFSYKGISLSVYMVYYGGNFFRARQVPDPITAPNYGPLPSYLLNSWTPTKTDTDVPGSGQYFQPASNTHYSYADNLVRAADFIKIRNIVLGYDLPRTVASRIRANSLRVRFQLNDPKSIWTKQKDVHVDPETGAAPIPTSFVFGINANF